MHLAPPLGVTPFEFCRDFRRRKPGVPGLSCGVVCAILHLAVSVERRLVTDGRTDTRRQQIPALASVARVTSVETEPRPRHENHVSRQSRDKTHVWRLHRWSQPIRQHRDAGLHLEGEDAENDDAAVVEDVGDAV